MYVGTYQHMAPSAAGTLSGVIFDNNSREKKGLLPDGYQLWLHIKSQISEQNSYVLHSFITWEKPI